MSNVVDVKQRSVTKRPYDPARSAALARSLESACLCAKVCDELRGKDTVVLDLSNITPMFDFFVITTGTNRRQLHAIAEESDRVLAESGSKRLGIEGYEGSTWIVQDYGDVVLHVFTAEARELYDLEHLWGDAPHVDWHDVVLEMELSA